MVQTVNWRPERRRRGSGLKLWCCYGCGCGCGCKNNSCWMFCCWVDVIIESGQNRGEFWFKYGLLLCPASVCRITAICQRILHRPYIHTLYRQEYSPRKQKQWRTLKSRCRKLQSSFRNSKKVRSLLLGWLLLLVEEAS